MASLIKQGGLYYLQFFDSSRTPNRKRVPLRTRTRRVADRQLLWGHSHTVTVGQRASALPRIVHPRRERRLRGSKPLRTLQQYRSGGTCPPREAADEVVEGICRCRRPRNGRLFSPRSQWKLHLRPSALFFSPTSPASQWLAILYRIMSHENPSLYRSWSCTHLDLRGV